MMKIIKILVVEPNQEPYVVEIKNNISAIYGIVYFPFEELTIEKGIVLIHSFNSDSFLKANRIVKNKIIYGSFAIVGKKRNDFISLTNDQIKMYTDILKLENNLKMKV